MMRVVDKLCRFLGARFGAAQEAPMPPAIERFVAWNRQKWPQDQGSDESAVVLISAYHWNESIFCHSYAANYLARATKASICTFLFRGSRGRGHLDQIYQSFGAKFDLGVEDTRPYTAQAEVLANQIFGGLKTKADVVRISVDGVLLGDHIYDFFLREHAEITVNPGDKRLRELIRDAITILFASRQYLATHRVTALIPDHLLYLNCGILTRLAILAGIPVFQVVFGRDFYLNPVAGEAAQVSGAFHALGRPYPIYRQLFRQLTLPEQERARERGRRLLGERLAGVVDDAVLPGQSAYQVQDGTRIFTETGKPRVLVLLHEFCDAPHCCRRMIFADYYEWIVFVLEKAEQTLFEWYVKPHPTTEGASRQRINEADRRAVAELKQRFPKIHFLPPSTSNRQIVEEGIASMFTVHGTAGHEFAYLGVPVVNGGDNPHIDYSFNFHPQTAEDLAALIERAGHLKPEIDRQEIEEFVYMHTFYLADRYGAPVHPIESDLLAADNYFARCMTPEIFDAYMAGMTPQKEAALDAYFQKSFAAASTGLRASVSP